MARGAEHPFGKRRWFHQEWTEGQGQLRLPLSWTILDSLSGSLSLTEGEDSLAGRAYFLGLAVQLII
jgi:hypothetical protein